MKKFTFTLNLLLFCLLSAGSLFAQSVGVGTTTPDASAELDVTSTDKGILIPRVNIANLNMAAPVASPATALMVYNTNATTGVGFYSWDGSKWIKLLDQNSTVSDNDWREFGTNSPPTNINANIFTGGNVAIGNVNPTERLYVNGTSFHHGIKVDVNGNTLMYIQPNDGAGNYQQYWNTIGGLTPTRIVGGIAYNEHMNSVTANSTASNYQFRYGGFGAAGSAISWENAFSINYNNGFMGIKTNTPAYELDVNGDGRFQGNDIWGGDGNLRINADGTGYIDLRPKSPTYGLILREYNSTDYANIEVTATGLGLGYLTSGAHLTIEPGGNVGIGKTNPNAKLDVNGGIRWGTAGASLGTGQGANMEMRGTGTPYIDFSNDATTDYDARIILSGNNRLTIQGAQVEVTNMISATRMKVTATGYPDYVFYDDYELKPLNEVQEFIKENGHLPGVPSEKEIVKNGLDLNDQSMWQQEKIEELFLHMIEMDNRVKALEKENSNLKKENKQLKSNTSN